MTVGANHEEELEIKELPPQEDEEDEDEPSVTPGGGKFLSSDLSYFLSQCGFREQTAQRKRRKRRSPRRRKQPSPTLQELDFRNFSQVGYIRPERSASTKTSEENPDLHSI